MKSFVLLIIVLLAAACLKQESRAPKSVYLSEIRSQISVEDNEIEFLDDVITTDGKECQMQVRRGEIYNYKLEDGELVLKGSEQELRLTRVEGEESSILGTWKTVLKRENSKSQITIIFDSVYDVRIIEKCRYQV